MSSSNRALWLLTSRICRDTPNGSLARKGVFAPILVLALALAFTCSTAQAQSFSAPTLGATTQSALYPSPGSSLTATALSPTQSTLKWSCRSSNVAGYEVERAASSSGPWSPIATLGTNQIRYIDFGLAPSTAYYYRVIAYN